MRTVHFVIHSASLDLFSCIVERSELTDIQTLVPQPAVERLYVPIVGGFFPDA